MAIPEDDLELVRLTFEAWNEGDYNRWEGFFDSEVVVAAPEGWPEAETITGREAWMAQAGRLRESWEYQRIDVEELRAVDGHVLAVFTWVTRGKDSGIEFETRMASVSRVRDGRIVRQEYFLDPDEARRRALEE